MLGQGSVIAGYEVESVLGRGGMGTVFRARDRSSGRIVALKVLTSAGPPDAGRAARLRSEGRAQAALAHPHVVTVYEAGESDHGPYLAMQLVDGPSLAALLEERALGAERALALLDQVASALDAAHAQGLVHRDVKPHNVLVGEGDHAYLADFGLTRVDADATGLTSPGTLAGTFAYLAPEVIGGREATDAADRYAFAAMAFECLTGAVVFPRSSNAAVLQAHAHDPPPRLSARRSELGERLDDVFARALAKAPAERPRSAGAFVAELRAVMDRAGTLALPPPPPAGAAALGTPATITDAVPLAAAAGPAAPVRRPSRRALIGAALAGAAAVGALWVATGVGGDGRPPAAAAAQAARPVPDVPGLRYLGTTLGGPAPRVLGCDGRPPGPGSPGCSVLQTRLPDATLVVPADGVIRRWGVRAARGEVALSVLRPRHGGAFQVALSATETVGSADEQWFDADVPVERGDLVALRVTPGTGIGVRARRGAATDRWLPAVGGFGRAPDRGAGTGYDHELLVRVGIAVGAERRLPVARTGAAVARLTTRKVLARSAVEVEGRRIRLALVDAGDAFAIDAFQDGRRRARIPVPEMRPNAIVVAFKGASWDPENAGLDVVFVNPDSGRLAYQVYAISSGAFERVR